MPQAHLDIPAGALRRVLLQATLLKWRMWRLWWTWIPKKRLWKMITLRLIVLCPTVSPCIEILKLYWQFINASAVWSLHRFTLHCWWACTWRSGCISSGEYIKGLPPWVMQHLIYAPLHQSGEAVESSGNTATEPHTFVLDSIPASQPSAVQTQGNPNAPVSIRVSYLMESPKSAAVSWCAKKYMYPHPFLSSSHCHCRWWMIRRPKNQIFLSLCSFLKVSVFEPCFAHFNLPVTNCPIPCPFHRWWRCWHELL